MQPASKNTSAPAIQSWVCRTNFSADLLQQLDTPLQFVDFLREPEVDANTGEITNEHPSYYESVQGGLSDIKCALSPSSPALRCTGIRCRAA